MRSGRVMLAIVADIGTSTGVGVVVAEAFLLVKGGGSGGRSCCRGWLFQLIN